MGALLLALLGVGTLLLVRERVRRRVLQTRGQLLAIIAATVVSYVSVVVVVFAFGTIVGAPAMLRYGVDETVAGFDAASKLQPGDVIVATDGVDLTRSSGIGLAQRVAEKKGSPITLTIDRGRERREVIILPKADGERWLLGIKYRAVYERDHGIGSALRRAVTFPLPELSTLAASDEPEPGGPRRIVEELTVRFGFLEGLLLVLMQLATYALYIMFVVDLARAALALRRR